MNPKNQPPKTFKKSAGYDRPEGNEREGGDDSLANASPDDSRADEKVIVNEQRESKIVNEPSQTAAHPSEIEGQDEDVVNGGR